MNSIRPVLWLYLFLAILAGPLVAAEYVGKVVAISDGDTLTLLVPDEASFKQVRVRLAEIDTPESRQPYGQRAPSRRCPTSPLTSRPGWWCRIPTATGAQWGGCTWAMWT